MQRRLKKHLNNTGATIYNGSVGAVFLITDMVVIGINSHWLRDKQLRIFDKVPFWKFID